MGAYFTKKKVDSCDAVTRYGLAAFSCATLNKEKCLKAGHFHHVEDVTPIDERNRESVGLNRAR